MLMLRATKAAVGGGMFYSDELKVAEVVTRQSAEAREK